MQLPLDLNLVQRLLNSSTVTGDLNNLTTNGFYYVQEPVNSPTNDYQYVIVSATEDHSKVFQLCSPDGIDSGVWVRHCYNGNWSGWDQLGSMTHLTTVLDEKFTAKFNAKYLSYAEMTALNGVTIDKNTYAYRLDFDNVSLLFVGMWLYNLNAPEAWKQYPVLALPQSFVKGYTHMLTIPKRYAQAPDTLTDVDLTLDTAQLSMSTRNKPMGNNATFEYRGLFLLHNEKGD